MSRDLIAMMRERRRSWVYLDDSKPEKAISFLRPTQNDMLTLATTGHVGLDQVLQQVDGWRGITADDISPGCGLSDKADFDKDLLREWLADRFDLVNKLAARIVDSMNDHALQSAATAKN